MTLINPLQIAIQHLENDVALAALVGDRIDMQHHYLATIDRWAKDESALQVLADGGVPELYLQWQRPRLEFRCYGKTRLIAWDIYLRLVEIARASHRTAVPTANGTGFMYWMNLTSGPSYLKDTDIEMSFMQAFGEIAVHEQSIT